MTISYIIGDATSPQGDGNKILVHVCNDIGGWGRGFVTAVSQRWAEPERSYRDWYRNRQSNNFELGAVQLVQVEAELWVANLIGQRDIVTNSVDIPVRYDAIEEGLNQIADEAYAMDASVHMPRIGCGLAGGDWSEIVPIIDRTLIASRIPVTVYDLS